MLEKSARISVFCEAGNAGVHGCLIGSFHLCPIWLRHQFPTNRLSAESEVSWRLRIKVSSTKRLLFETIWQVRG